MKPLRLKNMIAGCLLAAGALPVWGQSGAPTLVIRIDDLGALHSVNEACIQTYRSGIARSVEVMPVAAWYPEAIKMLRAMFRSRTLQTLFSALHPRWSMELGLNWAKHSRLKRIDGKEPAYMGENNEYLVLYTKEYLKSHPNINYFIYGHRHIELDLMLSSTARILILGDWINYFSYAVFDGENLFLENFVEGETKL